jgi:hypothetical protein
MRYLFLWDMMLHHEYVVSDNSGKSSDLKMPGTKPKEAASYPSRVDRYLIHKTAETQWFTMS